MFSICIHPLFLFLFPLCVLPNLRLRRPLLLHQLNETERQSFNHLVHALKCGAPPHGGIALGKQLFSFNVHSRPPPPLPFSLGFFTLHIPLFPANARTQERIAPTICSNLLSLRRCTWHPLRLSCFASALECEVQSPMILKPRSLDGTQ